MWQPFLVVHLVAVSRCIKSSEKRNNQPAVAHLCWQWHIWWQCWAKVPSGWCPVTHWNVGQQICIVACNFWLFSTLLIFPGNCHVTRGNLGGSHCSWLLFILLHLTWDMVNISFGVWTFACGGCVKLHWAAITLQLLLATLGWQFIVLVWLIEFIFTVVFGQWQSTYAMTINLCLSMLHESVHGWMCWGLRLIGFNF